MNTDYCVFIGRFQPFHNAHLQIVKNALRESHYLILVIGSYRVSESIKNPWTYEERKMMIKDSLTDEEFNRIIFTELRDYMYSDTTWISSLQNKIATLTKGSTSVKIIGHFKDDSSTYLKWFPKWELVTQPNFMGINGTDIRHDMFEDKVIINVPIGSESFINAYIHGGWHHKSMCEKERFTNLKKEYKFIQEYKKLWEAAPFPPTFVTTDAVVVQSGHILVVRRKINPGKGKLALPGGFLGSNEKIFDSCIREVYEETKIDLPKIVLKKSKISENVFDHPSRSTRGRTITHAYLFKLDDDKPLPNVRGADDAEKALWVSFDDLSMNEENFFEDHLHIITHFINKI